MATVNTKKSVNTNENRREQYRRQMDDKMRATVKLFNSLYNENLSDENRFQEVKEDSFQPKSRVRRQYDPEDDNISGLFKAIRKHNTGNPPLSKLDKIKDLLSRVTNVNDIDLNDNDNTPLHVAVIKGHKDIVDLLLKQKGIDVSIKKKNKNDQIPLDIAKKGSPLIWGIIVR